MGRYGGKMRIALCLYGLVGGLEKWRGKKNAELESSKEILKIGADFYHKNLIDSNNVDVFVHSWSKNLEKEIIDLYSPENSVIENQKKYNIPNHVPGWDWRKHSHYSRWSSTQIVVDLKRQHEKKNNIKYDFVMLARFDHALEKKIDFSTLNSEGVYSLVWPRWFEKDKPLPDKFYFPLINKIGRERFLKSHSKRLVGYPHNDEGLLDQWICMNSENMNNFANLYNLLDDYSLPGQCPTDSSGQISAHRQSIYHLQKLGLEDKISLILDLHDDYPLIRRKYFFSGVVSGS